MASNNIQRRIGGGGGGRPPTVMERWDHHQTPKKGAKVICHIIHKWKGPVWHKPIKYSSLSYM